MDISSVNNRLATVPYLANDKAEVWSDKTGQPLRADNTLQLQFVDNALSVDGKGNSHETIATINRASQFGFQGIKV